MKRLPVLVFAAGHGAMGSCVDSGGRRRRFVDDRWRQNRDCPSALAGKRGRFTGPHSYWRPNCSDAHELQEGTAMQQAHPPGQAVFRSICPRSWTGNLSSRVGSVTAIGRLGLKYLNSHDD